MSRVLISAGHTVMDPGQIYQDLREADLTRKIAPKIIPYIEKAKVEVKGVPLDLPLLQRLEWINNTGYSDAQGDVCIEIHVNDGNKRGVEAWFLGEGGNNSHKLAKVLVDTITADTGYQSQGIHPEHEHELRSLTFLNRSNPTTVLLETLFIDNAEDIKILKDDAKLEELAKSVARGILRYIGKDLEGNDLPADQKPKYDDLKPIPRKQEENPFGDLDSMFDDMPSPPPMPQASTAPAPKPFTAPSPVPAFGGTAPGFGSSFGQPMGAGSNAGSGTTMMDREQRKQMVTEVYSQGLGREPTQSDLNYFLNSGISKPDLLEKIFKSQEHLDLVKAKQELEDVKKKIPDLESQATKSRAEAAETKEMLASLQQLLAHKNKAIADLEGAVYSKHGMHSSVLSATQQAQAATSSPEVQEGIPSPQSWRERLFHNLSKRLNK